MGLHAPFPFNAAPKAATLTAPSLPCPSALPPPAMALVSAAEAHNNNDARVTKTTSKTAQTVVPSSYFVQ